LTIVISSTVSSIMEQREYHLLHRVCSAAQEHIHALFSYIF